MEEIMSLIGVVPDKEIYHKVIEYHKSGGYFKTKSFDHKNRRIELSIPKRISMTHRIEVGIRYINSTHIHPHLLSDDQARYEIFINLIKNSDMYIDHITNKRENNLSKIFN